MKSYTQTKLIFEIDKLDHNVFVDGYVHFLSHTDVGKKIKTITVEKVTDIGAWFDDGEPIELNSSYMDVQTFIDKARHYLTIEFLSPLAG